jgi:hypothetical protein
VKRWLIAALLVAAACGGHDAPKTGSISFNDRLGQTNDCPGLKAMAETALSQKPPTVGSTHTVLGDQVESEIIRITDKQYRLGCVQAAASSSAPP